jgi:ATP-dependent Lon protease
MFMALVSLMTERTVSSDTAMTGEISLRGSGSAGRRHQGLGGGGNPRRYQGVLLPARNRKDYEDIPEEVRKGVAFT